MELLVDWSHRRLQHAVDAVFHIHRVILGLDMDVAGAALDRRINHRIDEPDYGANIAGQSLDGEALLALFVLT